MSETINLCCRRRRCPILEKDGDKHRLVEGDISIELAEEHLKKMYEYLHKKFENVEVW